MPPGSFLRMAETTKHIPLGRLGGTSMIMKKTYIEPSIRTVRIRTAALLSGSIGIDKSTNADLNEPFLSPSWEEDEDEE